MVVGVVIRAIAILLAFAFGAYAIHKGPVRNRDCCYWLSTACTGLLNVMVLLAAVNTLRRNDLNARELSWRAATSSSIVPVIVLLVRPPSLATLFVLCISA